MSKFTTAQKFDPAIVDTQQIHVLYGNEVENVNWKPVEIPRDDKENWEKLKAGSYFFDYDEKGKRHYGYKGDDGSRNYFSTENFVREVIELELKKRTTDFGFDPTTGVAPQRSETSNNDGGINLRDTWMVTKAGTWDGMELVPGDILGALETIKSEDIASGTAKVTASSFHLNKAPSGLSSVPSATTEIEGTVMYAESIRLDGSASDKLAASEKDVADVILAVKAEINTRIDTVKAELEKQIGEINTAISTNKDAIAQNAKDITAINEAQKVQDGKIDDLATDVAAISDAQKLQDEAIAKNTNDIAVINEDQARQDKAIQDNANTIKSVNEQVQSEVVRNNTQDNRLAKLEEWSHQDEVVVVGDGENPVLEVALQKIEFQDPYHVKIMPFESTASGYVARPYMRLNATLLVKDKAQVLQAVFASAPAKEGWQYRVSGMGKARA